MPNKMLWTERIFSKLPLYDKGLKGQIVVRFLFLLLFWITGFLVYLIAGTLGQFVFNVSFYSNLFGTGMIILVGAYQIQKGLRLSVKNFRPLVDLDDGKFAQFTTKLDGYCFSTIPILLLAVVLFTYISGGVDALQWPVFSITRLWGLVFVLFVDIITATGLWMGVAVWLTIFLISKEPLKVDLSQDTINKFRGLTGLALWFCLFYFIALSLGLAIPLGINPSMPILDILLSPLPIFILLGVLWTMLPFMNLHNALLSLKRRELENIEKDFISLQKKFDEESVMTSGFSADKNSALMGRFFSLQIRERKVRMAQEWPIDISFISKLILLVLIPVIVRVMIWVIMGIT